MSTCIRFLRVGEHAYLHDPKIIENVLERAPAAIEELDFADMADICHSLAIFDYKSPRQLDQKLLPLFLTEIRNRVPRIGYSPRSFHTLLYYLTVLGYHDHEIISNALRKDFLEPAYRAHFLDSKIFGLNAYAQINLKGMYDGHVLAEKYIRRRSGIINFNKKLKDNWTCFGVHRVLRQLMGFLDVLNMPYQLGYALSHYDYAGQFRYLSKTKRDILNFFFFLL